MARINLTQSVRPFIGAQMRTGLSVPTSDPPGEALPRPGGIHLPLPLLSLSGKGRKMSSLLPG